MQVPSFETFSGLVVRELELVRTPRRGDSLVGDCAFDSLALFELYALVLDSYGIDIEDIFSTGRGAASITLGEVYETLVRARVDSGLQGR